MALPVPEVFQCTVRLLSDGRYEITHDRTGDAGIASDEESAQIQGVILRFAADLRHAP